MKIFSSPENANNKFSFEKLAGICKHVFALATNPTKSLAN